ncbi:LysR family transcriptional regulator, partial [Arthrobacter stackebrandtii]
VPALEYGVVTRKDEPLSASARAFVEILLEGARQRQKEGTAATASGKA